MPGEIRESHLNRKAYIYIRQSSAQQVSVHQESRSVQCRLVERAKGLGWPADRIIVIDEDLGKSADGAQKRPGFERLLNQICGDDVGALIFLYASRLARNGQDWHQILEVCSIFGSLIIDRDGIYDPRLASDRLWLGMKASFSEYENKQMQVRAREAIRSKALRGELIQILPAGFILASGEEGRIELDPDERLRQAIKGVFSLFRQLGSIRQVCKWYQDQELELPVRDPQNQCQISWRIPVYSTVYHILTNPLYAGIYMYPKSKTITRVVNGQVVKTAGHRLRMSDCLVLPNRDLSSQRGLGNTDAGLINADKPILIRNLFRGYISEAEFIENQGIIAENANMKGQSVKGAVREGRSLLPGLLRCGHCGSRLSLRYYSGKSTPYYYCPGIRSQNASRGCLSFSGKKLEAAVVEQMMAVLQPHAIQAAIIAEEKFNEALREKSDSLYYALEQARYEAGRLERQFNAVEPENHLVSRTLAARWEEALRKVEELDQRHQQALQQQQALSSEEREALMNLAEDLGAVWHHPNTDSKTKTRLVRLLIEEIWIKVLDERQIKATIHWKGGIHTEVVFSRRRPKLKHLEDVKEPTPDLFSKLAAVCEDQQIARVLNRNRIKTAQGKTWSEAAVANYRQSYNIAAFSLQKYQQSGLINLSQAANILDISNASVLKLIRSGILPASQVIKYAPWKIEREQLSKSNIQKAVMAINKSNNSVSQKTN
jgi:DNA invertase Pin-like site-specific DNA recombinase